VLDNPDAGRGPVLLGSRIEDPGLPTVLVYGHGDVVRGEPQRWRKGLDPWLVTVEGDKVYGRGVVDNKGQHLIAIEALRAVLAARGRLGFNAKVLERISTLLNRRASATRW
jgi:acetylornithine deacetylase/succinyl-diaminopimelate desuccinylase-like protein